MGLVKIKLPLASNMLLVTGSQFIGGVAMLVELSTT